MEAGLPIIQPERAARTVKVGSLTSSAACHWTPYSMFPTCGLPFTGCRPSPVALSAIVPGCRAQQRHARALKTMMALWKTTQV